jgi:RNA recognition motif-containing protein
MPEDKGSKDNKDRNSQLGKRKEHGEFNVPPSAAKVFVGGLDYNLSEDDFRKHFETNFGAVKAA